MADTTTLDDLAEAEAAAGALASALARFLHPAVGFDADRAAIAALEGWRDYCRLSCGFLETGECAMGGDLCRCPCGHDDAAAV